MQGNNMIRLVPLGHLPKILGERPKKVIINIDNIQVFTTQ